VGIAERCARVDAILANVHGLGYLKLFGIMTSIQE